MSKGGSHAKSCGENSSDYQAKKITALKDGLRNHDRQCGVQERKAAGEREDDRYQSTQHPILKGAASLNANWER
jgi:hypothetical protein